MKYKPPALSERLKDLPEDLQIMALRAIKEEVDRFERGDFTEEEKRSFELARELGASAQKTKEKIITEIFSSKKY
jgi:hypothetical protein